MSKTIDLSPKMKLVPAEQELVSEYISGERPLGESMGGLQMFSNVFKRGYGDSVFGSSENGIWLGAADFPDAPFSVDMEGKAIFKALGEGTAGIIIDADDKTIVVNDGTNDRIIIGLLP